MVDPTENTSNRGNTALKRIEHGLTYKHEIRNPSFRRRSLSPQKSRPLAASPGRVPLTCIKKPSNTKLDPVVLGKHDLTKALSTAEKENDDAKIGADKLEVVDVDSDVADVQSSPVGSHQNRMTSKRHLDTPLAISGAKKVHLGETSFQTPLREQSKRRVTPHREHHSRLVDDSEIDLHNPPAENPVLDLENSPLANVSHGQLLEDKIDGETEVINGLRRQGTHIHDISAIAANSSMDHNNDSGESDGEQDEKMSPVKLSQKISALDVFNAMIDQEEEIDDFELVAGDDLDDKPLFTQSQLDSIKLALQSTVDSLSNEVKEKNEKLSTIETALTSVSSQLESETEIKKRVLNEKAQLVAELESCKQSMRASNTRYNMMESRFKFHESKLEKVKTVYNQLMNTAKNLESSLEEKSSRIQELESLINSLKEDKVLLSNEKIELSSSLELKQNEIEELNNEKLSLENQLKEVVTSTANSSKKTDELVKELELKSSEALELREKLNEQSLKMENLELDLSQANEKLTVYQEELKSGVDKVISLENELNGLRSEIDALKERETALIDENTSLKEVMNHRRDEIKRLKTEKEELGRQITYTSEGNSEELEKVRNELISLQSSTEARITEMSANLESKNEKLVEAKTEVSGLKQRVSTLENQLEEANTKIRDHSTSLEQQLEKLAQDLYLQYSAKHEQKVAILKKGYEMKWLNKFKKLNKENEQLRSELESFKRRLEVENNEKKQLVKLWEEYVSLESNDKVNALPDFIKKGDE
ncbi:hypothetical protein OGAPHI_005299 [Ogataea philodendri]|uniref:Autophagy-related protein 23 n=1 Tax=Ogataea philodendri TaxID=1378263 RepID=A0A9P8P1E2_9ASCO|nr:uncharacterized protein OGAPHI_005299 [Ogataea philodendri]KAH3663309.1 hypothetical protein OGAPHI_005299 [Ogataea philodendri]